MPSTKKARRQSSAKRTGQGKKSKAAGTRKQVAPRPATQANQGVTVELRTPIGKVASFQSSDELKRAAMQWSYILSNRRRWNATEAARQEQTQRCQTELGKLGINREHLRLIAGSDVVEVSFPFTSEKDSWEVRIFPWEYMLSAATRPFRQDALTVIRHLHSPTQREYARKPEKLLIVESAPGDLGQEYSFESERNLVSTSLDIQSAVAIDETRTKLQAKIVDYAPDVIHLSGFDNNQAASLGVLGAQLVRDGYLLTGDEGVDPVEAEDLARLVNAAARKPSLVSCNIFYSAARVASLIVAEGAGAAIGFQDEFDDALTELFFSTFYEAWRRFRWDKIEAFKYACTLLKQETKRLMGTGVVLWSAQSLIKPQSKASEKIKTSLIEDKKKVITLDDLPNKDARDLISVDIKASGSLNYSMLHNNCELFEKFVLRKERPGRINDIQVNVVLYVGGESSRYSCTVDMTEKVHNLNRDIRVPLTYSISLLNNENIHTGLFVEVCWQSQVLHRQTYRVTLPPLDEWRGSQVERVWLPSFVLPRDPAISKIIDTAQTYLMALRDNSNAGFDGYQAIDLADNSTKGLVEQVRAIWAALIYNLSISYVNPPPTYNIASQRLRTPSEIVSGRRGTCIDLALLLAACLEYIDIYPVIFLFKGHALPGYWQTPISQSNFKIVAQAFQAQVPPTGEEKGDISTVQRWPWYHQKDAYLEIMEEVRNDRIIPLETVGITQRDSYIDSWVKGKEKLENKDGIDAYVFEGMIDITQARDSLITPIPRR